MNKHRHHSSATQKSVRRIILAAFFVAMEWSLWPTRFESLWPLWLAATVLAVALIVNFVSLYVLVSMALGRLYKISNSHQDATVSCVIMAAGGLTLGWASTIDPHPSLTVFVLGSALVIVGIIAFLIAFAINRDIKQGHGYLEPNASHD
jgi:hypothetical protein